MDARHCTTVLLCSSVRRCVNPCNSVTELNLVNTLAVILLSGQLDIIRLLSVLTVLRLLTVKRYSMALHAGDLQTLSIFELLEHIVSEVSSN